MISSNMRFFVYILAIYTLCGLSSADRLENYVEVYGIDVNALSRMEVKPPQDPAIHSFPTESAAPVVPVCIHEGYYRDPFNCRKFYICQGAGAIPAGFYCQAGLIFNTINNSCEYSEQVEC
ncbi:uncharacterized protein LOC128879946 [Hylaeus volcanicus]|uniref:uncharacterized protein LOC128879946 n=1 Tax=Hylaeus volcanicus TaxID=313075 RepID=UPI0023B8434F|nr:uncharacterized protein LOC128879946 [Hylaeus volcanicus]